MSAIIERIWYGHSILKFLLWPCSWVYHLIIWLRRKAYTYGYLKSYKIDVPVIVVGNLTVGGTGKTPLIILLAQWLVEHGYKPGIVSRGYGSSQNHHPIQVTADSDANLVGDEPVLIAHHTQCPIVIAKNRVQAVHFLLAHHRCNLILSDDGLQHYALQRDLEIAVIDGKRRYGNNLLLPAGPLREPTSRLNSIKFIVANGEAQPGEVAMQLTPAGLKQLSSNKIFGFEHLQNQPFHAVAGIGNPQRFFDMLHNYYTNFIPHRFADHYKFTSQDFNFNQQDPIVMTEKDAVKCRAFATENMYFVPVTAEIIDPAFKKAFLETVEKING